MDNCNDDGKNDNDAYEDIDKYTVKWSWQAVEIWPAKCVGIVRSLFTVH